MSWSEEVEIELEEEINSSEENWEEGRKEEERRRREWDRRQWTMKMRSNWADDLNEDMRKEGEKMKESADKGRKKKNEEKERNERKHNGCKNEQKVKNREHWFGDCGEAETEESSEEEEENTEEWEKVERRRRNNEKRKRIRERKMRKMEEIAERAKRMVGIGPIRDEEISSQMTGTKNYERAKVRAIKEHLMNNYRYNEEELENLNILETKRSQKGDNIIYMAMEDKEDVRDIYARKAELRVDGTTVKNFIPPQFYGRFMAMNRLCAGRRQEDEQLKTQIRFGVGDLEFFIKRKGEEEPYNKVNLRDFAGGEELPGFEDGIKWRCQQDRPPRRRVGSGQGRSSVGRGERRREETGGGRVEGDVRKQREDKSAGIKTAESSNLTRQNSSEEHEDVPRKKLRKDEEKMEEEMTSVADETL